MRDDLDDPVDLPAQVRRVVSLVPSLTEAIAATRPELLVGATDWCTHPEGLAVTRVRGTKNPDVNAIARLAPDLDLRAAHAFADRVAARGADEAFDVAVDFLADLAERSALAALETRGVAAAAAFAEAHDEIGRIFARTDALNLDRKAAVLAALRALAEAARN